MDQIIHKDLKTAIAACAKYEDEILRLQCKLGVTATFNCEGELAYAEYYDEGGKQKTYYH